MMDCSNPQGKSASVVSPQKPKILLAACGSVAAVKCGILCHGFSRWAEVKIVATKTSFIFIDRQSLPMNVPVHCDEHEWQSWKRIGDMVLHIELCKWADIMVIAPLSANTLAKIAGGVCDNLLTCIVRSWDFSSKPLFVAPSMNRLTWNNPITKQHCVSINELGITLIPPVTQKTTSGEHGCAMAEPENICYTVLLYYRTNVLKKRAGEA